jgi:hypothetical protein
MTANEGGAVTSRAPTTTTISPNPDANQKEGLNRARSG